MPLLGKSASAGKTSGSPAVPARTAPHTPEPELIPGKTYRGMAEFEAWQPYRAAVKVCNETNENYIALREPPSAFNYPAALQHLLDHGWRAAHRPAGARRAGAATIGGQRAGAVLRKPAADPVSPLRRGLGRAPVNNWDHIKLFEQVNAVAFRGDTRPPEVIFAADGFHPPSTRLDESYCRQIAEALYPFMLRRGTVPDLDPDMKEWWLRDMTEYIQRPATLEERKLFGEYHFWRQVMKDEEMHLQRMTDDSFLKGYISTTRSIATAAEASKGSYGGRSTGAKAGWIYVLEVRDGFLLKLNVGGYKKNESEISKLGPLQWPSVVGFAYYDPFDFKADLTIYMRRMFRMMEYVAFKQALATLSTLGGIGRGPLE